MRFLGHQSQMTNAERVLRETFGPEPKPHIYCKLGSWHVRFPPSLAIYNNARRWPDSFEDAAGWARYVFESERRKGRERKRSSKTRWLSE